MSPDIIHSDIPFSDLMQTRIKESIKMNADSQPWFFHFSREMGKYRPPIVASNWLSHRYYGRMPPTKWKTSRHLLSKKCHLLSLIDKIRMCHTATHLIHIVSQCWKQQRSTAPFEMAAATRTCHAYAIFVSTAIQRATFEAEQWITKYIDSTNKTGRSFCVIAVIVVWSWLFQTGFR